MTAFIKQTLDALGTECTDIGGCGTPINNLSSYMELFGVKVTENVHASPDLPKNDIADLVTAPRSSTPTMG